MKETIRFEKYFEESTIHNPQLDNRLDTQVLEIRKDPLTGHKSVFNPRLKDKGPLFFGSTDDALVERLARESESRCFLCGDKWEEMTPSYPEDILPGGRAVSGEAVLFPNLFPLAQVHAVIRVGKKHHLSLQDFDALRIQEAFEVSLELMRALSRSRPEVEHFTINGNFLHPAGASIAHPHFQVAGAERPFTHLELLLRKSNEYFREHKRCYWEDLAEVEQAGGERNIWTTGPVSWIAAFSPLGSNEVLGILSGKKNFLEVAEEDMEGFAVGLSRVLKGFDSIGRSTFNFTIYSGPPQEEENGFRCFLRVITRQNVCENYRTDDYFLQKLLRNELILTPPEDLAIALRTC